MFKVLAVGDHASALHSLLFHLDVLVPEAIIVVPVVDCLRLTHLVLLCLNIVNLSVRLAVEISLHSFDFSINLEVLNVLLLIHDLHALTLAILLIHRCENSLSGSHLLKFFLVELM